MIDFFGIFKGLRIQKETDRSKQLILQVGSSATANTATTVEVNQTANRTVTLPDASGALMTASSVDTLTNKTYDADGTGNVLTNIDNANIKSGAAIDASKIADGSVSNAEFQRLDGVTSNIQTQLDSKIGSIGGLTDNHIVRADGTNQLQDSAVTLSDSGAISGATIDADANTITNIENADIKVGAAIARSKLANGTASQVLINDGSGVMSSEATLAKVRGGSGQDNSSLTFPSTGILATLAGTEQLTNKDIDGGTASNTSRLTIPQNTTTNLAALTRKEATIAYDTTLNQPVYDNGAGFQTFASGGTPTGDANSLAYFDSNGDLASDNQELQYIAYTTNLNPSGIIYGQIDPVVTVVVEDHSLIISNSVDSNTEVTSIVQSIAMGRAENGAHLRAANYSLGHGIINGANSTINADQGSHAHGSGSSAQAIIQANNGSHAFGQIATTSDGRVIAQSSSLAFGDVSDDGFFIDAQGQSLAGGRTNANGGVIAREGSISFGEDINQGVAVNSQFNYLMGQGHKSSAPHVTKFGRYSVDISGNGTTWVDTDPLFVLGNGTGIGSRSNAFRIDKDGRKQETGAEIVPVRIVTSSDSISARTDRAIIVNGSGVNTLSLPAGETGLKYSFAPSSANTGSWALDPDGSDTVDTLVPADVGSGAYSIIFISGTWYKI